MTEEITIERLLIVMLFFCMGGRYLRIRWNGRSMVIKGKKAELEENED